MLSSLVLVIYILAIGLICMGCFWLGAKVASKEPMFRDESPMDIVEFEKEADERKTPRMTLKESEVMDGNNIEIPE